MAPEKKAGENKAAHNEAGHEKGHAGNVKAHAGHSVEHARAEEHVVHKDEAVHVKDGAKPGENVQAEKGQGKQGKAAKKVFEKKVVVKISKSKEVKRLSRLVRAKKRPMFRGRFGQRSVRSVKDAKWKRWRKPRGIDIYFRREDGLVPGTGYQRPKEIRFVHPSGYRERLVCNMAQLLALEKEKAVVAARISGKVGKRKKELLLNKADELLIVVLNR